MKIPSDLFENKQLKLSPLLIKSYIGYRPTKGFFFQQYLKIA